jgi:hypothetical protein
MYASAHSTPPPRSAFERFLIRRWEYRHPGPWLAFRLICGGWNVFLAIALLSYGYWFGLVPLAGAALIFWTAYRIWIKVHG